MSIQNERRSRAPLILLHHQRGITLNICLGIRSNCHVSPFHYLRRGTRRTVPKISAGRAATNPALDSSTRTGDHTEAALTHPPRCLKETLCALAFSEQEFIAISTTDAYIRAARDRLTGVTRLFSKDIQVKICANLIDMCQ